MKLKMAIRKHREEKVTAEIFWEISCLTRIPIRRELGNVQWALLNLRFTNVNMNRITFKQRLFSRAYSFYVLLSVITISRGEGV